MPSPLPDMNPLIEQLEQPELWSEFHSRMIVAIADALDDSLSRSYRVAVEKRVYDRARFELAIDYTQKLSPQLSSLEQKWVLELVNSQPN